MQFNNVGKKTLYEENLTYWGRY